jgi:anaphase-promoting complex subunit 1
MSIIMAGSGDLVTLRKLRAAYGSYAPEPLGRYGGNTANHMAIGMLFLGTGRYTLGTSNAAIASMVAAFYPRFAQFSSDNKCYLQALRHLWVLAVEPRCVVARDVDTGEIVNVPFKARVARPGAEEVLFTSRTPELVPDIELVKSLKIETPRYWPAYVDMSTTRPYRSNFIRNQTIWVKRRSAFLSYNDDPSGARCLLVRSHMSTADAATLEVPESATLQRTDQSNLMPFVSSFSSDPLFLATADRLCRESPDATEAERVFAAYCRAALQDALFQDKPHTLQTHLNLLHTRFLRPSSRVFQLRAHHARFCDVFYQNTYDHCFSGKSENNTRPPLLRPGTTASAVQAIDAPLEAVRQHPLFRRALGQYARGERVEGGDELLLNGVTIDRALSWYLLRESVPPPTVLGLLRMMAEQAHTESIQSDPPVDVHVIDEGIKLVIHRVGTSMTASIGGKWSMRSLDEIIAGWSSAGV